MLNLDIKQIRNQIAMVQRAISKYYELVNNYLLSLKRVDSVWNDNNTEVFIAKITEDEAEYYKHKTAMNAYLTAISSFCDELERIYCQNLGITTLLSLKYRTQYVQTVCDMLNQASNGLIRAKQNLTQLDVPSGTGYRGILNNLLADVTPSTMASLQNKMNSLKKAMDSLISCSKANIQAIDFGEINDKLFLVKYRPVKSEVLNRTNLKTTSESYSIQSSNSNFKESIESLRVKPLVTKAKVSSIEDLTLNNWHLKPIKVDQDFKVAIPEIKKPDLNEIKVDVPTSDFKIANPAEVELTFSPLPNQINSTLKSNIDDIPTQVEVNPIFERPHSN